MEDRLDAAFADAPRALFLPEEQRGNADVDVPLPIGFGVTNSQPSTVRNMLDLLDVREGMRVLDVGSGSGWTSALLAELVGPSGEVFAVERIEQLVDRQKEVLGSWGNIRPFLASPGVLGLPEKAPFDRILVSAMAKTIPQDLTAQLADIGVMVVPVQHRMVKVVKLEESDDVVVSTHGLYSFVPLIP